MSKIQVKQIVAGNDTNVLVTSGSTAVWGPASSISPFRFNSTTTTAIEPRIGSNNAIGPYSFIGGGSLHNTSNGVGDGWGAIAGGYKSRISGYNGFIGGGSYNVSVGDFGSAVVGGSSCSATTRGSFVGGGQNNKASSTYSSVIGGSSNETHGDRSFIGGGLGNIINTVSYSSFIGGGNLNTINGIQSTIVGGRNNIINTGGINSTIVGGSGHTISGQHSSVLGGKGNIIGGEYSSIVGGITNRISGSTSTTSFIGGGVNNTIIGTNKALSDRNIIVGGSNNYIAVDKTLVFIGGGRDNTVNGEKSIIVGGYENVNNGDIGFIGGGSNNTIVAGGSGVIVGGQSNRVEANTVFIGGGYGNNVTSSYSFIGSGKQNLISGGTYGYNTIVGGGYTGKGNRITDTDWSSIGGGYSNTIQNSSHSTILGGYNNTNNHTHSHIIGSNITSISGNTTHVENFNVGTLPVNDNTLSNILVRDSNGMVRYRTVASITAATVQELNDLTDVTTGLPGSPTVADDGRLLYYDSVTSQWISDEAVGHGTVVINGKKGSAGTIAKGLPVYLTGFDNDLHQVELADADGGLMPVIGFTAELLNDTDVKKIISFGKLQGLDTTSGTTTLNPNGETWVVNDSLYMSTTPGGLTKIRPTGANTEIQRIAQVLKVDATGGQLFIFNTARVAGLPNLTQDNLWIGNSNNQPVETTLSSLNVTTKYTATSGFTASSPITFTHNLGTEDVVVNLWEDSPKIQTDGTVEVVDSNNVKVTMGTTATFKVVIIG